MQPYPFTVLSFYTVFNIEYFFLCKKQSIKFFNIFDIIGMNPA